MNKLFRILHVAPFFQKTSGVSTFVGEIAMVQAKSNYDVCIATLPAFLAEHYPVGDGVRVVDIKQCLSWRMLRPSIVHIHGIWTPVLHRVVSVAKKYGIPIVWSTHGMLARWAMRHKGWKKWLAWRLWQKHDLAKASVIHITAQNEAERVRALGLHNTIVNVPLGTSLAGGMPSDKTVERMKTVLFVGRLHPIKGLENLIQAWAIVKRDLGLARGWKLRLVGPDQAGYKARLLSLCTSCRVRSTVEFVGPEHGETLANEYRMAAVSVLPSFTENFGGVVIDSLACGCPVIASTGTPWAELRGNAETGMAPCGWWVDNAPSAFAKALAEAISLDCTTRARMGETGRKRVLACYTWARVSELMMAEYAKVMHTYMV